MSEKEATSGQSDEVTHTRTSAGNGGAGGEKLLFWACFIALVATSFGFVVRAMVIGEWGREFGLSATQQGQIFGVGLWPFAVGIVLFSLVIDRIGYGKAMLFAFVCHVSSAVITIFAKGYWGLYIGTFTVALGNGTVEAVINPAVATLFPRDKTKWLNILHAGWPGGLVLGGLLALGMGDVDWRWKVGLIFIPTIAYGIMLLGRRFPVHERVKAGVTYKGMLQEAGIVGCLIVVGLIVWEVTNVFAGAGWLFRGWSDNAILATRLALTVGLSIPFALYVRTLGRGLFILLLLIMIPLAITELGTDSWVSELMTPEMAQLGLAGGWVLVYTSLIMMILRFLAGPIVHRLSPPGLLAVCSLLAAVGLAALSKSTGIMILAAATLYAVGKTFFWPTMLGMVAERFPRGGALTLNSVGAVGMLGVGVVGAALLGNIQDKTIEKKLKDRNPALHARLVGEEKISVFGRYRPISPDKLEAATDDEKQAVTDLQAAAKKDALMTVAIFPVIMFVCYLGLIIYFKSKGGYRAELLVRETPGEDQR